MLKVRADFMGCAGHPWRAPRAREGVSADPRNLGGPSKVYVYACLLFQETRPTSSRQELAKNVNVLHDPPPPRAVKSLCRRIPPPGESCEYYSKSTGRWIRCGLGANPSAGEDPALEIGFFFLPFSLHTIRPRSEVDQENIEDVPSRTQHDNRQASSSVLRGRRQNLGARCKVLAIRADGALQVNVKAGCWLSPGTEQFQRLLRKPRCQSNLHWEHSGAAAQRSALPPKDAPPSASREATAATTAALGAAAGSPAGLASQRRPPEAARVGAGPDGAAHGAPRSRGVAP
ncbi:unnamed protein product [Prorocentrum cordatum]|uniref:Uncharacterized protein n=1 Tax=Prorocentrum cordatum TaxID=2364126 RepID=A0ABN9VVG6_9DINO|nr:unnamed protein product [Polarella glacialis]